jgi:hypothetical protein
MTEAPPPLSVVMPVHNAGPYLDAAVASILGQSFAGFEFVILDDASTDGSAERLRAWAERDSRIRLVTAERNLGPAGSSARVVAESRAALVARMDADDVSAPDRLARQMAAMADHPELVLVGTLADTIAADGRRLRPADRARLLERGPLPPFQHASILFRRAAFDAVGGYRAAADRWEDVDLFLRLARIGPIATIDAPLLSVRVSPASTRISRGEEESEAAADLMLRCLGLWVQGRSYDHLLAAPRPARLHPSAFLFTGAVRLWAGERPGSLARIRRRGRLGPDRPSLAALGWALAAGTAPAALRRLLLWRLALRNRRAARRLSGGLVPWNGGLAASHASV